MNDKYRVERDSMGAIKVPAYAYWGAQDAILESGLLSEKEVDAYLDIKKMVNEA